MTVLTTSPSRGTHPVRAAARIAGYGLALLVVVAGVVLGLPYLLQPSYRFPATKSFAGTALYNPYAGLGRGWQRVNFHAHARAWLHATDGRQSDAEVVRHYRALGYQAAQLSNYQHITGAQLGDSTFLPVYEHGYNVDKIHQLVIGARRVDWLDFPWHQTIQNRQFVLDRLHRSGALVVVAHPELRDPTNGAAFRWLTNYDLMEVRTHSGLATAQWDTALSTGHIVWGIADDDTHDIDDPETTGREWTMVNAASAQPDSIVAALRAGRMYAVDGPASGNDVALERFDVRGDTVELGLSEPATRVEFSGARGAVLASLTGVAAARFVVPRDEPYVRTVIETGRTTMYLNPVIRYDGVALARPIAVATPDSRGQFAAIMAIMMLLPTWLLWRRMRRRRSPAVRRGGVVVPAAEAVR